MFISFFIYFHINFDFESVYYIDDGFLELGSETTGLVAYLGNLNNSESVVIWKS